MPTITHRLEEELLGALIYDPGRRESVPTVQPEHFADIQHALIFAVLEEVSDERPGTWGAEFTRLLAERIDQPPVDQTMLNDLALACSDVGAVVEYGRDVHAAAIRRELHSGIQRLTELVDPGPFPPDHPLHQDYEPLVGLMRHYAVNVGADLGLDLEVAPNGKSRQVRCEEMVLADLIQRPYLVAEVDSWLAPEAFTSANRRDIYQAIVSAAYGEADAGWGIVEAIAAARAVERRYAVADLDQFSSRATPGYIGYLARSGVAPGSCLGLGRDLMTDLLRAEAHAQALGDEPAGLVGAGHQKREERLRIEEAIIRYGAGLPSRDQIEQDLYRRWEEPDPESPGPPMRGRTSQHRHLSEVQIRSLAEQRLLDQRVRQLAAQEAHHYATRPSFNAEQLAQLEPPF